MASRTTYRDWITKDGLLAIETWASNGLLNKDIAKNCGVAEGTFKNWITQYDAIRDAIKKGRKPVVREIENALIKAAKGYEYTEEDIYINEDQQGNIKKQIIRHKKYARPDTSAGIFLLKNYAPDKYRNYSELTKRQIEAEIKKLTLEADKMEQEIKDGTDKTSNIIIIDDIAELAKLREQADEAITDE